MLDTILKILPAFLLWVVSFVKDNFYKKWRQHKVLSALLTILMFITVVIVIYDHHQNVKTTQDFENFTKSSDSIAIDYRQRLEKLQLSLDSSLIANKEIKSQLEPVIEIAKAKFPNVDVGIAVSNLIKDVERIKTKEDSFQILKTTVPKLNVKLHLSDDMKYYVRIDSETMVPFECQFSVVTKNNIPLSGIPIEWAKAYPRQDRYHYSRVSIDKSKVIDNYIELEFEYRSIFAAEMQLSGLTGTIIRKYSLADDGVTLISLDHD